MIGTTFFAVKPRIMFTSSPLLTPKGKHQISKFDKRMVISQFDCYCDNSYIGLTTRQFKKRVKEHIPTCVDKFLRSSKKEKENKYVKMLNAAKRFAITEHLVNNQSYTGTFNLNIFK